MVTESEVKTVLEESKEKMSDTEIAQELAGSTDDMTEVKRSVRKTLVTLMNKQSIMVSGLQYTIKSDSESGSETGD